MSHGRQVKIYLVLSKRKSVETSTFYMLVKLNGVNIRVTGLSGFSGHTTEKSVQKRQCFSVGQNVGQLIKMYSTNFVDNMVGKEV